MEVSCGSFFNMELSIKHDFIIRRFHSSIENIMCMILGRQKLERTGAVGKAK